ncbi:hypothetical protein ACIRD8_37560 [Streptomyces sp. NPDC102451]|uniref:hypothetical protein n=1 Tax=Streptomyces sp. NPDC102451 TaxID=3366177 RepID=UPI003809DF09
MDHVDRNRVAQVVVRHGDEIEYGSGYRISTRLILTVAHLFTAPDRACTVMLGYDKSELPVTLIWRARSTSQDLALLRLDAVPAGLGAASGVAIGRLPDGMGSVPFVGVGFPALATRPESARYQGFDRRDSKQVHGQVQLGSNMKSGLLDLTIMSAPPPERADGKDPWKGISGTALFGPDGHLIGVQAQRLTAAGTSSADAESVAKALDDPEFARLLGENLVNAHAMQLDLPNDRSPGRRLRSVVSQQELIRGFGDFEKNLTSDQLPFVFPGSEYDADPRRLLTRLVTSADRGVLMVGAAGTGKTRTGLEVGQLAIAEGWRVLHLVPHAQGGPVGDQMIEEIAEQAFARTGYVLVVIDLNETNLDLQALRQLLAVARRSAVIMVLLASARPGWLLEADRALVYELFDEVHLRQDEEFQQLVTRNALETLAPTAIDRLGMERMLEVSGNRPIVGLLVAREMERRVEAGLLSVPEVTGLRSGGELTAWLLSRLREDRLTVPGRTPGSLVPASAPLGLVAAAAAAAACPQDHAEVVAAAKAALASATGDDASEADGIVATLVSLGWLEIKDGTASVAHDIVADQLMESVMLPEPFLGPDVARTRALLAGSLTGARTIGRFAVNLGRLVNDLALDDDRASAVEPLLCAWFTQQAVTIGDLMCHDSNAGSYALGAICSGPPWSDAAVGSWDQVVSPWLSHFGGDYEARHVLHRGLRHLPTDGAGLLVPAAADWLKAYGRVSTASYIAGPLLSRTDVPGEVVQQAIPITLDWLNRHAAASSGGYVLRPLLARTDLSPFDARRVLSAALVWLSRHAATHSAGYVLDAFLSRTDLSHDDVRRVLPTTREWLDRHATTPGAGYVLRSLLPRTELEPDDIGQAVQDGLAWLDAHAVTPAARYVLRSAVSRTDLSDEEVRRLLRAVWEWMDAHATTVEAESILSRLIMRTDLPAEDVERVLSAILDWLGHHAHGIQAEFVLGRLVAHTSLSDDDRRSVWRAALDWLDSHAEIEKASFILKRLLGLADVPEAEAPRVVAAALAWLDHHGDDASAGHIVGPLLSRPGLPPGDVQRALRTAFDWLDLHPSSEASFVLKSLLARTDLAAADVRRALGAAFTWLGHHGQTTDAGYILNVLLARTDLTDDEVVTAYAEVFTWLALHAASADAGYVLGRLLARHDLPPTDAQRVLDVSLDWLGDRAATSEARFVLSALEARAGFGPPEGRRAAAAQLAWLATNPTIPQVCHLLARLLKRADPDADDSLLLITSALTWLDHNASIPKAQFVLNALLSLDGLNADHIRRGVAAAFTWLDEHAPTLEARFVLEPLLGRGGPEIMKRAAPLAVVWLDQHVRMAEALRVLSPLLTCGTLSSEVAGRSAGHAVTWLGAHASAGDASFVLGRLLGRGDLGAGEASRAREHALAWLLEHSNTPGAGYVLKPLLSRADLRSRFSTGRDRLIVAGQAWFRRR